MKNLQILAEKDAIHTYAKNNLKTDIFRRSYEEKGFVWNIVEDYAHLPRLVCDTTHAEIEHAHFYSWMNVLPRRQYDNPIIDDLYNLHEMIHAGRMAYVGDISYEGFKAKMTQNELEASVGSEIQAYFEMPGLREQSFPHPIYADRFLSDSDFGLQYDLNPKIAYEILCAKRRDVMLGLEESKMDITEKWIKRFSDQNATWFGVWHNRYKEVELSMEKLTKTCLRDPSKRKEAIQDYAAWLTSPDVTNGTDIPFYDEAVAFNAVYRKHRKDYDAAMSAISKKKKMETLTPST